MKKSILLLATVLFLSLSSISGTGSAKGIPFHIGKYIGKICFKVNSDVNNRITTIVDVYFSENNQSYDLFRRATCHFDNYMPGKMEINMPGACSLAFYTDAENYKTYRELFYKIRVRIWIAGITQGYLEEYAYEFSMRDAIKNSTIYIDFDQKTNTGLDFSVVSGKANYDCNDVANYPKGTMRVMNFYVHKTAA